MLYCYFLLYLGTRSAKTPLKMHLLNASNTLLNAYKMLLKSFDLASGISIMSGLKAFKEVQS